VQSDNGLLIDVGQVRGIVENADVFAIGFSNFAQRLLVDTRSNDTDGPLVQVVEPLNSVQERLFWLGKERGSFGMPESFTFFAWPHSLKFLEQSGLWQRIRDRVGAARDNDSARQCEEALNELRELEGRVVAAAITGEGFVSLWEQGAARADA
jgi:hypothetical protein